MRYAWTAGLVAIELIALALRLHGIHNPLLDHPGWRQGDTAAIARNFDTLQFNVMYPQTMYDGPPPNYVELELQIVPFLSASIYKLVGIHPIVGRLASIAFSLGTVATLAFFGRWLFAADVAGFAAAFFYAVFPGSIYYGRAFMPDAAMVFFLTAGLFAAAVYLMDERALSARRLAGSTALLTLAYLAKPVAALAAAPLLGMVAERVRARRAVDPISIAILVGLPFVVLTLYDRRIDSYAEWHWASGITRLHVLPALARTFTSLSGLSAKLGELRIVLGMLRLTVAGAIPFALAVAGFVALPWIAARSKALMWGWLIGGLLYVFVVVTVERVDYYMLPLLPLFALVIGGALARFVESVWTAEIAAGPRYALNALVPLVALAALLSSRAPIAPYYHYNAQAYRNAIALRHALPLGALIVMGHYGPDVQYYIDRFGWEEDPLLWTPFDEESAIAKGARYFVSIEENRLHRNVELCAWLQRFPRLTTAPGWPVYETDPAKVTPAGERFWREFRRAERLGAARSFLQTRGLCLVKSAAR